MYIYIKIHYSCINNNINININININLNININHYKTYYYDRNKNYVLYNT